MAVGRLGSITELTTTTDAAVPSGSHTVTAGTTCLIVSAHACHNQTLSTNPIVTAVTWNGNGLTRVVTIQDPSNDTECSLWKLENPTSGSGTLTCTLNLGQTRATALVAANYDGTPTSAATDATQSDGISSIQSHDLTLTTNTANSMAVVARTAFGGDTDPQAPNNSETELADAATGTSSTSDLGYWLAEKLTTTAGAYTLGSNASVGDNSSLVALELLEEAAGVGAGTLTLTGFGPKLVFDQPIGAGALSLTGFAPVARVAVTKLPGSASLILTGFAPALDLANNLVFQPGAGALVITGQPVTIHTINAVGAGQLTLTGFAPVATIANSNPVFTPDGAILALTGFPPTRIVKGWKPIDESEDIWTEIPPDGGDVWTPVTESTDTWT